MTFVYLININTASSHLISQNIYFYLDVGLICSNITFICSGLLSCRSDQFKHYVHMFRPISRRFDLLNIHTFRLT